MNRKFNTSIVCLKDVANYNFSIPTYQRPYVWGEEQLKKLIDDFYHSFKNNNYKNYFIGAILTKENKNGYLTAELVDGQQRFTSLWLMAFVMSELCPESNLKNFLKLNGDTLRLDFEIRDEVKDYLNNLLDKKTTISEHEIEKKPFLKHISKAITILRGLLINTIEDSELELFGNYIYTQVKFIKNTTPENTDLNKLFATINNSGVQLEQTDIIKARLLNKIDDKKTYSKIWEACENMNGFFEKNASLSFPESNWNKIDLKKYHSFNSSIFKFKKDDEQNSNNEVFNINDLIKNSSLEVKESSKNKTTEKETEEIYCRSIINFPQLLLHTYRIHLKKEGLPDFEGTFHISRLIEILNELVKRNTPEEIKRFIILLWDIRYLFDKYIIKWIQNNETKEENLELSTFNKNSEGYYTRSNIEKTELLMLQSVMYFTGDYLRQYWLTSYLYYLFYNHNNENVKSNNHLNYLEKIDDIFSLNKDITDKELSFKMLNPENSYDNNFDFTVYLNESNGTSFKHYWFYKLEYILWKNWENKQDEKYKKYRITSKNSIEHIYPQKPEDREALKEVISHSFGNLVLLSVSQNSEYSNKSVKVKQAMFQDKNTYDSLKSYHIFKNKDENNWEDKTIEIHKNEMIELIKNHYNK